MLPSVNCDFRTLGFASRVEAFSPTDLDLSQRTITFGIDTAACKTVVLANHPAAHGYLIRKVSLLGCAYSTAGKDKVYDQGKRILHLGCIRKVDGH